MEQFDLAERRFAIFALTPPEPATPKRTNLGGSDRAKLVGTGQGKVGYLLKQRIADGDVTLRYLPDEQMPADFLTKWLARAKVEKSVVHATNSRASGAPQTSTAE